VLCGINIQQATNHPLILRVVLARFLLEKLDAAFAQADRDLHAFIAKSKF
jgi:hypothetical protein